MKVHELIALLSDYRGDMDVFLVHGDDAYGVVEDDGRAERNNVLIEIGFTGSVEDLD